MSDSDPNPAKTGKGRIRRAIATVRQAPRTVPGPSTNPATNLLIASVAMRGAAILLRRGAERGLLRARFDADKAKDIVQGRTFASSMIANATARVATKSVPGFLLVTGGLLAKTIIDRSLKGRFARRQGEAALLEQAENAPE